MSMSSSIPQQNTIVHPNGANPAEQTAATVLFRNDASERVVLSAMLLYPEFVDPALAQLEPGDFADSRNRDIFLAMRELWERNEPIDTYLLSNDLEKRYNWTQAETLDTLDLVQYTEPEVFAHSHIKRLKTYSMLRSMAVLFPELARMGLAGATADELHAYAEQRLSALQPAAVTQDEDTADDANPLKVVPPAQPLQLGWIDDYARLMTRLTGSPFEFNRLCGLVTAAAAIQRRAVLRMSFGDVYPNIFAAIIARSSVYHKSSALSKPRAILKRANLERLLLSELATSEGLLKQLSTQPNGIIVRDEIGTLFASHNQKYLVTLKPDLTALYDCYPYSRRLSNDAIRVDTPYLNILGATTPARFYEGVTYSDWADGFLARWLFVMPDGEPDFDAMTGLFTTQHDTEIGSLAAGLVNIDRQRETDFVLLGDSHQLWDTWQRKAAKDAYLYDDDVTAALVTRYAAYALKFAMILAAVNGSWGIITPETMLTAMDLADSYKSSVGKLLAERSNYGISGAKLQKVFGIIIRKGGAAGVNRKVLMQFAHLKAGDVTLCIEKLLEIGAIVEDRTTSSPRYLASAKELPIKTWK